MAILFSCFCQHRFLMDFGPNLAPTWAPRWTPNRSKIAPRDIRNRFKIVSYFWSLLWPIFDIFLADFRPQNQSKINQKSINKPFKQHNNKKSKKCISYWQGQWIRAFGHVMLCTKFNKIGAKIPSKTSVKSTSQLGSILEPTWLHFGRVLGAKLEPRSHQIAPKVDLKKDRKKW